MENLNLPPFYVGQKVVFIGESLPKNSIHTIHECIKMPCGCWVVDIGIKSKYYNGIECVKHNVRIKKDGNSDMFHHFLFVPIESTFRSITFEDVIEIESPLIGIN